MYVENGTDRFLSSNNRLLAEQMGPREEDPKCNTPWILLLASVKY